MFITWVFLTFSMDLKAPIIKTAKFYFLSQLGKYLPGNIGLFLLRLDAYKGYSKKKVAVTTMVEYIVNISGFCIAGLIGLSVLPVELAKWYRIIPIVIVITLIFTLNKSILFNIINKVLKTFKREQLEYYPAYPLMLLFVFFHIIVGFLMGLAFLFSLKSITIVSNNLYLPVAGVFMLATLSGIMAPFAPGGIGVREGMLFLVLPILIPKPAVIVGAIIIRLVVTFAEIFLTSTSFVIYKLSNPAE
jgi:uncharacterized membrane protein YbhN (UPF0104 family)